MTKSSLPTQSPPRLPLGRLVTTPGAYEALAAANVSIVDLLNRHACGDWGDLCADDRVLNNLAAMTGQRVLSSYRLPGNLIVHVLTAWDRSVTTVLLPDEY